MVVIEGWAKTSEFTAIGFAKRGGTGCKIHNIYDISRDGMLAFKP